RAGLITAQKERLHALPHVLDAAGAVERGQTWRLPRAIRKARGIKRENLRSGAFVKALAGFFANPSALDQGVHKRGHGKCPLRFVARRTADDVPGDVTEDVDPGNVHGPKRRAARAAENRTGDGIDFFDRVVARLESAQNLDHAE